MKALSFKCSNCGKIVSLQAIGTKHRNHCPFCLYSKHLDLKLPGDRRSNCQGLMAPLGLTQKKDGELMITHTCLSCNVTSQNRIAGDDSEEALINLLQDQQENTDLLTPKDKTRVIKLLFGNH